MIRAAVCRIGFFVLVCSSLQLVAGPVGLDSTKGHSASHRLLNLLRTYEDAKRFANYEQIHEKGIEQEGVITFAGAKESDHLLTLVRDQLRGGAELSISDPLLSGVPRWWAPLAWAALKGYKRSFELMLKVFVTRGGTSEDLKDFVSEWGKELPIGILVFMLETLGVPLHQSSSDLVESAIRRGDCARLDVLRRNKANFRDYSEGFSQPAPILLAVRIGALRVVQYIVGVAEIDPEELVGGTSALHEAVRCGQVEILEGLMTNTFDLSVMDAEGRSPLALAVKVLCGLSDSERDEEIEQDGPRWQILNILLGDVEAHGSDFHRLGRGCVDERVLALLAEAGVDARQDFRITVSDESGEIIDSSELGEVGGVQNAELFVYDAEPASERELQDMRWVGSKREGEPFVTLDSVPESQHDERVFDRSRLSDLLTTGSWGGGVDFLGTLLGRSL